jgi:hypothetical protein
VSTQKGILTSQELRPSGRSFLVDDTSGPPCFRDRWGEWTCGHDHEPSVPLEEVYQYVEGWTAQSRL